MASFSPPPIRASLGPVTTERLDLRRFDEDDLDELAAVFAKPEVWQFPYGRAFSRTETAAFLENQIAEWDECGFGCWVAFHRQDQRIIGYVGLSVPMFLPEILPAVEVGWRFDPAYWGQGYATEGARAALEGGFTTLGLDEITSIPQVGNASSSRVCEHLDMTLDRVVSISATARRGEVEGLLYRLTRDHWSSAEANEHLD